MGEQQLQFKVLPFGLATVPRVFTKVLVNPITYIRQQGVHVHPYLDDLLIRASSPSYVQRDIERVMQCLKEHGFLLNLKKSELTPTQRIQPLGMILDAQYMKIFQTRDWIKKPRGLAALVMMRSHCHLFILSMLLGLLNSEYGYPKWRRLHSRNLQWFLKPYQNQIASRVNVLPLPLEEKNSLCW